jgi:hypothetical protein
MMLLRLRDAAERRRRSIMNNPEQAEGAVPCLCGERGSFALMFRATLL